MFSCETDVDLVDAYPDSRIGARILLEKLGRPIVRRVVGDDKLEIREVLRDDRFDAPPDDIRAVSYGEAD